MIRRSCALLSSAALSAVLVATNGDVLLAGAEQTGESPRSTASIKLNGLDMDSRRRLVDEFATEKLRELATLIRDFAGYGDRRNSEDFRQERNIVRALLVPRRDSAGKLTVPAEREEAAYELLLSGPLASLVGRRPDPENTVYHVLNEFVVKKRLAVFNNLPDWLSERDDDYQTAYFSFLLETGRAKREIDDLTARAEKVRAENRAQLEEAWNSAIVLSDGRRVLPSGEGDGKYYVITKEATSGPDQELTGPAVAEARRIHMCLERGGTRARCR
jgi:hypothetical protein